MVTAQLDSVIRHLRRAVQQDAAARTDGQLLGSFIDQKDETAFEALVQRHGRMVFGVCRRIVRSHHDAEDAFQATFLVLARKAAVVSPRERVANWLHGVALRIAMKAKTMSAKRRGRERQVTQMPEPEAASQDQWRDLQPLLDQELNGLPANYRLPILLCDLEGKTIKEATQQLGWPQGTLAGRLARGRKLLAKRLANRGVTLSAGSLAAVVSQNAASAAVPASLMSSTVKAAVTIAAGQATVAALVPAKVAILMEGALRAMFLTKLKSVMGFLLAVVAIAGLGAGLLAYGEVPGERKTPALQRDVADSHNEKQPQKDTAESDMAKLQGVWRIQSMEGDGMKVSSDDLKKADPEQIKVWIVGDNWITKDSQLKEQKQLFQIDPSKSPKTIDIKSIDGTIDQLGIYRLEGDQLTICMWGGPQERPRTFASAKGSPRVLIVYQRVAKDEPTPKNTAAVPAAQGARPPQAAGQRQYAIRSRLMEANADKATEPVDADTKIINQRSFQVPVQVERSRREKIKELQLFVSADRGKTWQQAASLGPDGSAFKFKAERDGLYWFNVRIIANDGTAEPRDVTSQPPALKILVDTGASAPREAGELKELLRLPTVTIEEGQCVPVHITDSPHNLLDKVVLDEKIKIGTFLDVRVTRLGENKVRLFCTIQKNEIENSSVNEIRVLGSNVQTIQVVELNKPVKIVLQKDAGGAAQRWVEIILDEPTIEEEQIAPAPAPTARSQQ